jgi:hypothetical protein
MEKTNPFEPEIFKLRRPIQQGEVGYTELRLKPPVLRDMLRTDGHDPESIAYARALLSSLTGVPEAVLDNLIPEDWADLRIILAKTNMRFMGLINLFDENEDDGNPQVAEAAGGTQPGSSKPTSAG